MYCCAKGFADRDHGHENFGDWDGAGVLRLFSRGRMNMKCRTPDEYLNAKFGFDTAENEPSKVGP